MLTKDQFKKMKEDELCREVIEPLLRAMGYRDVTTHHGGSAEQGKDIVCWKEDSSGRRDNLAIVAKAVALTGQAKGKGSAGEVSTQVNQCFGEPFLDPLTGVEQEVHQCWIVTNQKITKEAEKAIQSAIPSLYRRYVVFVSGDKLWEYVEKYLLVAFLQAIDKAMREAVAADSHYFPEVTITRSGTHITLQEKYPGASIDKPMVVRGSFEFPNNPEGKALRDALDAHIKTGSPVEIPATYIKDIEVPEVFQRLTGLDISQLASISVSSPANIRRVPVKVQITRDDGEVFSIDYVELNLVQAGTEEATFNNSEQPIPFLITVVLKTAVRKATINVNIKDGAYNALQTLSIIKFHNCFTKPAKVSIVSIDTGIPVLGSTLVSKRNKPLSKAFEEMVADLAVIQEKVRRPIVFPDRNFTREEREVIAKLRTILHEGTIEGTWKQLELEVEVSQIPSLIQTFRDGEDFRFRAEGEEVVLLFGTEIPLGKISQVFYDARIEDVAGLEARLGKLKEGVAVLPVRLVPFPGNRAVIRYLDWQQEKTGEDVW